MPNLKPPIFLCMHARSNNYVINNYVTMRSRSLSCESCLLLADGLSEMALLKFLVKKNDGSDTLQLPSVSLCASSTLSEKDIRSANESVLKKLEVKKPTSVTRKVSTIGRSATDIPQSRGCK